MLKQAKEKMRALIGMLKYTNLCEEEIYAICSFIPTEECMDEIAELLIVNKEELKNISQQKMLNMCGQIIEDYLPK